LVSRSRCLRGIDTLSALGLRLGDWRLLSLQGHREVHGLEEALLKARMPMSAIDALAAKAAFPLAALAQPSQREPK
jgi:hypothetical protein